MTAILTPSGWIVEPDVVDERKDLPSLSAAQIAAINARLAQGAADLPVGTQVIRSDDGAVLTLQGIGAAASFQSAGSSGNGGLINLPHVWGAILGDLSLQQDLVSALDAKQPLIPNLNQMLLRLLPVGGAAGQIPYRTSNGYVWGDAPSGGTTTTPPPAEEDFTAGTDAMDESTTAMDESATDMNTQTATLE